MIDTDRHFFGYVKGLCASQTEPCRPRYIRIAFHPSLEDMYRVSSRHHKMTGIEQTKLDYLGLWTPHPFRARYDRHKKVWVDTTPAYAGVIRFSLTHLTDNIIAHECTHAALHLTRLYNWGISGQDALANFDDEVSPVEESFCYLVGDLVEAVNEVVNGVKELLRERGN